MRSVEIIVLGNVSSDHLDAVSMSISEYLGFKTALRGFITLGATDKRVLAYRILDSIPNDNENIKLVITDYDIYHPGYNFLFGLALPKSKKAVVSLYRLRSDDFCLELERIIKESIHELGHILGLNHCWTPRCVMNFSNTIWEVDEKNTRFCNKCKQTLETNGIQINSEFDHWSVIRKVLRGRKCL